MPAPTHHSLSSRGIDEKFFPPLPSFVRVRIVVAKVLKSIEEALFSVPVELLDKLLQSPRTLGTDGAVIDAEHLQRRFVRHLALSKALLNNAE